LQFAFDLPYKGSFNVAPLVMGSSCITTPSGQCGAGWNPNFPVSPATRMATQATGDLGGSENQYYRILGFLPPSMRSFSISGAPPGMVERVIPTVFPSFHGQGR